MALTQGAWTVKSVPKSSAVNAGGRKMLVMECDVTATTGETDAYTLKTPTALDGSKPWTLFVNTAAVTLDASGLPVDIWAGYDDDFAITGDSTTVAATSGGEVASAVMDDVKAEQLATRVDPNYTAAVVQAVTGTGGHVNAGVAPYYAINLDGASTLNAATCHFVITQDMTG